MFKTISSLVLLATAIDYTLASPVALPEYPGAALPAQEFQTDIMQLGKLSSCIQLVALVLTLLSQSDVKCQLTSIKQLHQTDANECRSSQSLPRKKGCTTFYKVRSGDTCTKIAAKNKLADSDAFKALNPGVNDGCTNLQAGFMYCVASCSSP